MPLSLPLQARVPALSTRGLEHMQRGGPHAGCGHAWGRQPPAQKAKRAPVPRGRARVRVGASPFSPQRVVMCQPPASITRGMLPVQWRRRDVGERGKRKGARHTRARAFLSGSLAVRASPHPQLTAHGWGGGARVREPSGVGGVGERVERGHTRKEKRKPHALTFREWMRPRRGGARFSGVGRECVFLGCPRALCFFFTQARVF